MTIDQWELQGIYIGVAREEKKNPLLLYLYSKKGNAKTGIFTTNLMY